MSVVTRGALSNGSRLELAGLARGRYVSGTVANRARIVLWWDEGRSAREIVELSGVSEPTVRLWPERYAAEGAAGLFGTPASVHDGTAVSIRAHRQKVLDKAYTANPDRFHGRQPQAPALPTRVWINQPRPKIESEVAA